MAVQPQTPYKEYTANGSTKSFALEFDCDNQDHLIVLVDGMEPVVGTWSLSGGAVVFGTAPTNGKKITIQRNTPFGRTTDYQSFNNSFRPPAVNKDFDWIWWKLQELGVADWILGARIDALKNYVDRKDDELKAYLMEEIRKQGVALDQLDEYYNYLMQRLAQIAVDKGWDASFVVDASGENQQAINNKTIRFAETIADLLAIQNPKDGQVVKVKGFRTATNFALAKPFKGGGQFTYISANSHINNGITIFNGWTRSDLTYYVTPEMAGAYSDGDNYDSDACQIAVDCAHEKSLQVFFQSESYLFDQTVNLFTGTNYKEQGSIVRGLGKAKTFIRSINGVDCFNVTNKNISHPSFSPNFELTDMSFEQTGDASKTGIAIKTTDHLNSATIRNVSFFNMKQALKMPHQFYIASIHNLHAQNCTYGYELGLEGTTLDIGMMFVTGGGGEPDSFAYKIRSSYSTIGSLACDNFDGRAYDFAWGEYHISALGAEKLKPISEGSNFSFSQCRFNVVNIKLVDVNELTESSLIIGAGDSVGTIKSVTVANSDPTSPATLFRSYSSNVDLGAYKGTTTFAKPTYPDQSNNFGVTVGAFQYQRGGYRPAIGLRYNSIVDYLTPTENPCKQSFIFDIYGSGFSNSGYSGDQDWQWRPAPLVGDWGIQRRPDLFGIAATVALAEGGNNRDITQAQLGVVPLVVFSKPATPTTGCIFVNKTTKKVEIFIDNEWVLIN